MGKIIQFPTPGSDASAANGVAMSDVDDEELDIRLWELTMSGQRGCQEYQQIEAKISRRTSHRDMSRQIRFH